MLALWSRAARTPGTCRCISCVSNTTAIARRSNATGIRAIWPFGTPTSTFCYTAVFAAGLAIDAKAKRDRNGQWEVAFSSLREEMSESSTEEQGIEEPATIQTGAGGCTPIEEIFLEGMDWDTIQRVSGTELVDDQVFENRQSKVDVEHISESLWDLLAVDYRFPRNPILEWPANTGPDLTRHYLPPQSLWAPEHMRFKALRRRQTWKKLSIQELSVGWLIHRLCARARISQLPQATFASLTPHVQTVAQLNKDQSKSAQCDISKNIAKLQALSVDASSEDITNAMVSVSGTAIPQYVQDSDGDFYHISRQMNAAIRSLLNVKENEPKSHYQTALAIAKLCHNLLVSSAAPDLQTFNILISGLKRWNRPTLVDDVIFAFEACKIRPNEITCAAILDHYIQTNRPDDFSRFVAKMRGVGDALMLARPDISINEKGEDRLVRVSETKVYQKVYPTPMVFNALMLGVLKFAGFERALDIYYEMKEDSWGLDIVALSHFLDDCIHRVDWHGGLFIWEEINGIKRKVKPTLMSKAYAQMLSLCSITMKTIAYNQILSEAVQRGFDSKRIVGSAITMARSAENASASLAPAWTADNLLIAVSGYMQDSNDADADESTSLEEADPLELVAEDKTSKTPEKTHPASKDPEEAWAAWMEHELGERMNKGPEK